MARAMKGNQSAVAGGVSAGTGGNAGAGRAGLGQSGLGVSGGQRLPVAPRERKPALAALAVLLILGGALASAYLVMASGQRVSAIRIVQPVAAGQRIPLSALQEVQVGDTGVEYYLRWSERQKVARAYAAVPLVQGALLTNGMLSKTAEAERGRVVVGLALKPGQLPAGADGLVNGARVSLYAVGTGTGSGGPRPGTVLSTNAIVVTVSSSGKSDRLRGDQTSVNVAVPPNEAPAIAQAASAGAVGLALLPPGTEPAPQQPPNSNPQKQQTPGNGNTQNPGPGSGTGNGTGAGNGNGNGNGTGPGGN
ncbi:hypothetical protein [Actinomadura rudentiformis]|uniref:hypothetical protein n=1 Tax=Actinomadura rudentiformis TaxID=359158 RepID=UPI00178C60A4|nr:hypothetical protein [Actinomadura rudentiformis]